MTEEEKQLFEYVARLSHHWAEAAPVARINVATGDWAPKHGYCHDNVSQFVERNPSYRAVRGWLIFGMEFSPTIELMAHSVVENDSGALLDITPAREGVPILPFLRHTEDEEVFRDLVATFSLGKIHLTRDANGAFEKIETASMFEE